MRTVASALEVWPERLDAIGAILSIHVLFDGVLNGLMRSRYTLVGTMFVGADHRIDFGVDCNEPLQGVLVGGVCHFRSNHAAATVFHAHRSRPADGATSGVNLLGLVLVAFLSFASERHDPSDRVAEAWDVGARRLTDSLNDGIHVIPCFDVRCPERPRQTNDPPVMPSVKGDVEALHGNRSGR